MAKKSIWMSCLSSYAFVCICGLPGFPCFNYILGELKIGRYKQLVRFQNNKKYSRNNISITALKQAKNSSTKRNLKETLNYLGNQVFFKVEAFFYL